MNVKQIVKFISGTKKPNNNDDWFKGTDVLNFLHQSAAGDVPVYLSGNGFYSYSVFVSQELLTGDYIQDMLGWNFGPSTGWGYGDSYEDDINNPRPILFSPLHNTGSKITKR